MIKAVPMLKRPPTMTPDEFKRWYTESHVSIIKKFPLIKRYVISLAVNPPADYYGSPDPGKALDGMGELWYDSMDDLVRDYASPPFKEAIDDVKNHGITIVTRMFAEEYVII